LSIWTAAGISAGTGKSAGRLGERESSEHV